MIILFGCDLRCVLDYFDIPGFRRRLFITCIHFHFNLFIIFVADQHNSYSCLTRERITVQFQTKLYLKSVQNKTFRIKQTLTYEKIKIRLLFINKNNQNIW